MPPIAASTPPAACGARDAEGAWNLVARGTTEAGAQVGAALDPLIEEIFGAARRRGERAEQEAYAFDALVAMARRARGLDGDSGEGKGGTGEGTGDGDGIYSDAASNGAERHTGEGDGQASVGERPESAADADAPARGVGSDGEGTDHGEGADSKDLVPTGSPPRAKQVAPTHLALLRLDLEALVRGSVRGEERCEITGSARCR